MEEAARRARCSVPGTSPVQLYKNNTDSKGASYGMPRELPDGASDAVRRDRAAPHAVLRDAPGRSAAPAGSASAQDGRDDGFQISQRADFFEVEVGLETTLKRPIINTRDEPHADPEKYRRLHVIIGDANMNEVSTFLKVGTTALVLAMIEDAASSRSTCRSTRPSPSLRAVIARPDAASTWSRAGTAGRMTAVQRAAGATSSWPKTYVEATPTSTRCTADVLARWEDVLTRLEDDPMTLRARARLGREAAAARGLPRAATGSTGTNHTLQLVDLQYHDVRQDKGLYNRLAGKGRVERSWSPRRRSRAR